MKTFFNSEISQSQTDPRTFEFHHRPERPRIGPKAPGRFKKQLANAAAGLVALAAASVANAQAVYTSGHGDFGIAYDAGAFDLHIHLAPEAVVDGAPVGNAPDGVEFAPGDLFVRVADPSTARPAGAAWEPSGVAEGSPLWILPAIQEAQRPFWGVGSEELTPSDWTGNLSIRLTAVNGPTGGQFSLFDVGLFGPSFKMSSVDGLSGTDTLSAIPGSHGHYNWAFSKPGQYALTFEVSGTHITDGAISSTGTYLFDVSPVPEPEHYAAASGGALVAWAWIRRKQRRSSGS